jgi:multiple sugar transport system substrate-binding protein
MSQNGLHTKARSWGLSCVIICLLVVPLSGCGKATPPPEPATIVFSYEEFFDTDYYEAMVEEFNEQYPYITVELSTSNYWELPQEVGPGVDVLLRWDESLVGLQEEGHILGLNAYIEPDASFARSDFYPGLIEHLTLRGETWAVPAGVSTMVMFYNQDMFDQYGVPYPETGWTWDDFLAKALALRDPDADVMGDRVDFFGYGAATLPWDVVPFIYQHGGRIVDDLYNPTRTTFNDPLTVEALEWYADLFHSNGVAPTPLEAAGAFSAPQQFAIYSGIGGSRVGMWSGASITQGGAYWLSEWFFRWGMAALPRDAQSATLLDIECYFISAQTPHPEACWQWISFLSQQIPAHLMPARRSLAESTEYEQLVGSDVVAIGQESMEDGILIPLDVGEGFEEAMAVFGEAVEQIIRGASTPQEAMDWAQREAGAGVGP